MSTSPLAQITNYHPATADIGTSGQPTADQFRLIADSGYRLVVNLALPSSDHALANEGSLVTGLGMSYWHLPVDFDAPTLDELGLFCRTLEAWRGQKVWVHCVVNARVSAFMFQYLTQVRGVAPKAATSPLLEKWEPKMDAIWKAFLTLRLADLTAS